MGRLGADLAGWLGEIGSAGSRFGELVKSVVLAIDWPASEIVSAR